jgi:hypothetical protein
VKARRVGAALAAVAVLSTVVACSSRAEPDEIGLYYTKGSVEGTKFQECVEPSTKGPGTVNDEIYWLNTGLATWNIQPEGGDTAEPITAGTKPDATGQAGPQVHVWATTEFYLNSDCTDENGQETTAAPVVLFWEKTGRRYKVTADIRDGNWKNMLLNTLVPVLNRTMQSVTRNFTADELDANIGDTWAKAEALMRDEFTAQLRAKVGGDYFCGPEYQRDKEVTWVQKTVKKETGKDVAGKPVDVFVFGPDESKSGTCSPVKVTISNIDYADKGLQDARAATRKAAEDAKRRLIEAKAKVDESNILAKSASDPNYMRLKELETALAIAQACAANPNCTLVVGGNGTIVNTK